MADQLLFKKGLQSDLDKVTSSVNGAFYLTTDTNRLYIGNGSDKPKLLNQTVQIIDSYTNLPTTASVNDFYYTTNENILCVCTANNGTATWTQINPDTDTDTKTAITSATFNQGVPSGEDSLVYTLTLSTANYDKNGDKVEGSEDSVTADLTLKKDIIAGIVPEMSEVGLEITSSDDKILLNTVGAGADAKKAIELSGTGNVTVTTTEDSITINGVLPELDIQDSALVILDANGDVSSSVGFDAGSGLAVEAKDGKFTYSHATYKTDTNDVEEASDDNYVASIDSIDNGHITKYTTKKFTKYVNDMAFGNEDATKYTITLKDANGDSLASQDLGKLVQDAKSYADGLIASEIAKVSSALQYKGIVDKDKTVTDPQIGWVYMSSVDGEVLGVSNVKVGDLLVYHEDEEGKKAWQLIPSGDELFTTYTMGLNSTTTGITYSLYDGNGDAVQNSSVLEIIGDDAKAISVVLTADGKVSIKHKEITVEEEAASDTKTSITAIIGIETDENGHITKYNTQTFEAKTYELAFDNATFFLKDENGDVLGDPVTGDGLINIAQNDDKIVLEHTKVYDENSNTEETIEATISPETSESIEKTREIIIKEPVIDEYGHITHFNDVTFQFKDDNTTYTLSNTNGVIALEDPNGDLSGPSISFNTSEHDNLTLEVTPTLNEQGNTVTSVAYAFNLTWGEF